MSLRYHHVYRNNPEGARRVAGTIAFETVDVDGAEVVYASASFVATRDSGSRKLGRQITSARFDMNKRVVFSTWDDFCKCRNEIYAAVDRGTPSYEVYDIFYHWNNPELR